MIPMNQRKKRIPGVLVAPSLPKEEPVVIKKEKTLFEQWVSDVENETPLPKVIAETPERQKMLERKLVLAKLHGIPARGIFVDPKNGVELYRSKYGWVHDPKNRGVE